MGQRLVEVTADVRQHAQVLLDPAAESRVAAAQRKGGQEDRPRRLVLRLLQLEARETVECLGGRNGEVGGHRDVMALPAEAPALVGTLAPPVVRDAEPAERLGLVTRIARIVGPLGRGLVLL